MVAERGVIDVVAVDAKLGVVNIVLVSAERGIVAKRRVVAKCGVVSVIAVNRLTRKQRSMGVGSMDSTFAHLPKEAVNEDLRFLLVWMTVDAAVRGNWSGANTYELRWWV